jgi:hypothetical protein
MKSAGSYASVGRALLTVAVALASTLTAPGCGGGDGGDPTGPPDRIVFIIPSPSTIAADGSETSQLIIHVVTLVGDPIDGAVVRLETDLGVFVDTGTRRHEVTTGSSGFATSALRGDGQAGTATVSARSGGFSISVQIALV